MLPATGKLPASILPSNIGGPRGPAGPAGPSGSDGSSAFVASAPAAVTLGAAQTSVESLSLKAGSFAIVAKASLHATLDTSTPGVNCQLKAGTDGDQVDADPLVELGRSRGAHHDPHVRRRGRSHAHLRGRRYRRDRHPNARILALRVGSVAAS